MRRRAALLALLAACGGQGAGSAGEDPIDTDPVKASLAVFLSENPFTGDVVRARAVVPVVYVPADQSEHPDVEAIASWMDGVAREVQGFYGYATGGYTFELRPVEILSGAATAAEVGARPDPVALVGDAKARRTGASDELFWVLALGAGDQVSSTQELGGIALVGESAYYAHHAYIAQDPSRCDRILLAEAAQRCRDQDRILAGGLGSLVHELGHLFGLQHEDDHDGEVPETAVMRDAAAYLLVRSPSGATDGLSQVYRDRLARSEFLYPTTLAGEPPAPDGCVVPLGDAGEPCAVPDQWRCAASRELDRALVAQVCRDGAWVDQALEPASCCECGPGPSAACEGTPVIEADPLAVCCRAGIDNFCALPANTEGCPMTAPGGFCDPNGDGGYDDADWTRGYVEYQATCGPTQCCTASDNFCHNAPATDGCPMTAPGDYCDPDGDGSFDDGDWTRGYVEHQDTCASL